MITFALVADRPDEIALEPRPRPQQLPQFAAILAELKTKEFIAARDTGLVIALDARTLLLEVPLTTSGNAAHPTSTVLYALQSRSPDFGQSWSTPILTKKVLHTNRIRQPMMQLRTAALTLLLIGSVASAEPAGIVSFITINAKQEKKDVLVRFERAAIASLASDNLADGLVGFTSDFNGGPLTLFIAFDDPAIDDRLFPLRDYQGKLAGTAQCKRVRFGTSAQFPTQLGVLAEQCQVKTLNH